MKNLLLALLLAVGVQGFSQQVVAVMIVVVDTSGVPVPNQVVTGTHQGALGPVTTTGITDANGVYMDSALIAPQSTMVFFTTAGGCADSVIFFSNPAMFFYSDTLVVCGGGTGAGCDPTFTTQVSGTGMVALFPNALTGQFFAIIDWGDGILDTFTPANLPSPITHTYNAPGNYSICLHHSNSTLGCFNSFCDSVSVGSGTPLCQALWTVDTINSINFAGNVVLWNLSTGGTPANPLNYIWDWGDGTTSTGAYPMHTYSDTGIYYVCLTVVDPVSGCTDTQCDSLGFDANGNLIYKNTTFTGFTVVVIDPATIGTDEHVLDASVDAYPNPTNGVLYIKSQYSPVREVMVFDLGGKMIQHFRPESSLNEPVELSIATEGLYLIRINTDAGSISKKVLVD